MSSKVVVAGVGMIPFTKPGQSRSYSEMGEAAARLALKDSGLSYDQIEQVFAGYVYADSTAGQAAVYGLGLTGVPIFNVNNACASGSTALFLARQAVESGGCECALAVGFEQMNPGALGIVHADRPMPAYRFVEEMERIQGLDPHAPGTAQFYGGAAKQYQDQYGADPRSFAKIAAKARRHATKNPLALFREEITVEEVLQSKQIFGQVTRLQCCPPTCGAAAAIVCSESFAQRHGILSVVKIVAQEMVTDVQGTFDAGSMLKLIGYDITKIASDRLYESAGIGPDDIEVVEMHDCFTVNEFVMYEALGLTPPGTAEKFIEDGDNTYGGKFVTNPSGGLLSKGHPLGATGLAQCAELVWQLRGTAGARQVSGARFALQHNLGLGGACVATLYTNA
jgi:sterol carrier protein 2